MPARPEGLIASASAPTLLLAQSGALLILLGLLTGGYAGAAMTGQLPVDPRAALAAHLNALLGGLWLFAVAWSLPLLRYGPVGKRRLAWALIVANFGNWSLTALKAALHVTAVEGGGTPANHAVFLALNAVVVMPSLIAATAWVMGLRLPAELSASGARADPSTACDAAVVRPAQPD